MEYCAQCDYDTHACMGCGCPTTHEGELINPTEKEIAWHREECMGAKS